MGMFGVLDVSSAGLGVQQARLEAAASNLANANSTRGADGALYRPLNVVLGTRLIGGVLQQPTVVGVVPTDTAPRQVYEPGHPDADERGFINLPGVDTLSTMLDLMSISRSYEANLRVFDITRTLLQRTLEMGARR